MATHCLCRHYTYFFSAVMDFDYPSSGHISETTMAKGRNVLEGEIMGCKFEFVGYWFGDRKHHHHHQLV